MKANPISTRDAIYYSLRDEIVLLALPPGTAISEKEMSIKFNVSRTPVRESFVRLSQEGLLEIYPQRGTVVSLIDLELVEEARFMREQLEKSIIQLACVSFPPEQLVVLKSNLAMQQLSMQEQNHIKMFELDEAFHRTLFEGCKKLNTWTIMQQMNVHLNRTRTLRLAADQHWDQLYTQHLQMIQAIEEHDTKQAEQLMSDHLHLTITDQALLQEKYPAYFKNV
ncbi:GntR family transcriptional regulator [Paenibacillus crassostreae]|uniref:GntR family transcriptional regulator n=2 Tax=Paenibacillus crassostreae TaxID=1763538 RepID=A0A167GUL8_9BACL|nr:GntR family transcriptional regulator [Paenibacillus crassostreae]AOZ94610.1 GntR family transcriptional regulator [Paenibacillus crassostreae]OAB77924.1 GntR family transcriptional regulator [Paenibacillus crassostreae]